jgi:Protein of unknown function (DUF2612).
MIEKTIMSQYANSPRLMSIITSLWGALDPDKFTDDFYRLVMDIPNANSYGLDIWGRIVGIGRTVTFVNPDGEYFGFEDGFYPFNERPFSAPGSGTDTWELTDDAYRVLILLKALANIVYASAPNINALMRAMFDKPCYCLITGHMQMRYVFEFDLSPYQRHLVYSTDILPRPCGVDISIIISADPAGIFGFDGSGFQPFGQGVFYDAT